MKIRSRSHMIDFVFTIALFCVFAATALMVVLIGARVYRNTVEQMNSNFDARASLTYVTTKIRANDGESGVGLVDFSGVSALSLEQDIEGETYQTLIYYYDGALMELFARKGHDFAPADGTQVMQVDYFAVNHIRDNLIALESVDSAGRSTQVFVAVRT